MAKPRLGAHMSIEGAPANALLRGQQVGCDTIQIFTRNANRWNSRDLTAQEISDFLQARQATGITPVVAHSSYLINLGSPDDTLWEKSLAATINEIMRCAALHISTYIPVSYTHLTLPTIY